VVSTAVQLFVMAGRIEEVLKTERPRGVQRVRRCRALPTIMIVERPGLSKFSVRNAELPDVVKKRRSTHAVTFAVYAQPSRRQSRRPGRIRRSVRWYTATSRR
jgi:hypothetical protein